MTVGFHPFPCTGDVALMSAKRALITAQTAVRLRRARFSHAAITIDDEAYIDSLAGRGIGIGYWADLNARMPIRVFRYRATEHTPDRRLLSMIEHYGKTYNFALAFKDHPIFQDRFGDAFYCSEFVARIYSRAELGLDQNKRLIMPIDLESLANNYDWVDVTEIYKPFISGSEKPSSYYNNGVGNASLFKSQGELEVLMRESRSKVDKMNRQFGELTSLLGEYASEFKRLADQSDSNRRS